MNTKEKGIHVKSKSSTGHVHLDRELRVIRCEWNYQGFLAEGRLVKSNESDKGNKQTNR